MIAEAGLAALWLLAATKATDKSVRTNTRMSIAMAISVSAPWTIATPRIERAPSYQPRSSPIVSSSCSSDSAAASHNAASPVSAITAPP